MDISEDNEVRIIKILQHGINLSKTAGRFRQVRQASKSVSHCQKALVDMEGFTPWNTQSPMSLLLSYIDHIILYHPQCPQQANRAESVNACDHTSGHNTQHAGLIPAVLSCPMSHRRPYLHSAEICFLTTPDAFGAPEDCPAR